MLLECRWNGTLTNDSLITNIPFIGIRLPVYAIAFETHRNRFPNIHNSRNIQYKNQVKNRYMYLLLVTEKKSCMKK